MPQSKPSHILPFCHAWVAKTVQIWLVLVIYQHYVVMRFSNIATLLEQVRRKDMPCDQWHESRRSNAIGLFRRRRPESPKSNVQRLPGSMDSFQKSEKMFVFFVETSNDTVLNSSSELPTPERWWFYKLVHDLKRTLKRIKNTARNELGMEFHQAS